MPINKNLAKNLKKNYGAKGGESAYFAMENSKGKTGKAFQKGLKTATAEGHTAKSIKALKPKKKRVGKGADAKAEPKAEAKREAKMGPKTFAAHEAAEKPIKNKATKKKAVKKK